MKGILQRIKEGWERIKQTDFCRRTREVYNKGAERGERRRK